MIKPKRQWADSYGPKWYLYKDGTPPRNDDNNYIWTGRQWEKSDDFTDRYYDDEGYPI